jgi:hypothetical protein
MWSEFKPDRATTVRSPRSMPGKFVTGHWAHIGLAGAPCTGCGSRSVVAVAGVKGDERVSVFHTGPSKGLLYLLHSLRFGFVDLPTSPT